MPRPARPNHFLQSDFCHNETRRQSTLPQTNSKFAPTNGGFQVRNLHFPQVYFQGRGVSFRESTSWKKWAAQTSTNPSGTRIDTCQHKTYLWSVSIVSSGVFFVPQGGSNISPNKKKNIKAWGSWSLQSGLSFWHFLSFPLPHFLNVKHLMLHGGISCVVWLEYFTNKERGLIKIPKLRSWFALVEVVKNILCLKSSSNTKTTQWYKSSPFSHPKNTTTQQSNFNFPYPLRNLRKRLTWQTEIQPF